MCIWHGVSARVYMARCVRVRVRARTHVGLGRLANEGFNQLALQRIERQMIDSDTDEEQGIDEQKDARGPPRRGAMGNRDQRRHAQHQNCHVGRRPK